MLEPGSVSLTLLTLATNDPLSIKHLVSLGTATSSERCSGADVCRSELSIKHHIRLKSLSIDGASERSTIGKEPRRVIIHIGEDTPCVPSVID